MWIYLLQGIGYGFAAASQPGPFQTYLITQSITRGWKRAWPSAFAPLISDGPIILLCVLVLNQVPGWLQRALSIAGGLFVLYLSYGAYKAWRNFSAEVPAAESTAQQSLLKGALTNFLSPGPYLFWSLVTGPLLVKGWSETPLHGLSLLLGFYITLIGGLIGIMILFGTAARIGPKVNRALLGISAIALFLFGVYQLRQGIAP